jgi:citrate synthase
VTTLTATEAAQRLGIKPTSLYVYVSRGMLRSEPGPGRSRRYRVDDVDRLIARREGAEGALDFGAPVLDSALTRIAEGRLFYRGKDALDLARSASLEDVARLLWQAPPAAFAASNRPALNALPKLSGDTPARLQALLALAGAGDDGAQSQDVAARTAAAVRVLRLVAVVLTSRRPGAHPCHDLLRQTWKLKADAADIVRAALVLCADHELNASSFVARCVASTGASLYGAVSAGLAALLGPRHGGAKRRVAAWFREVDENEDAARAVGERARRGDGFPGIGHPLYPDGDPRARFLLEALAGAYPRSALRRQSATVADAVAAATGLKPNLDFALVTVARVLGLPADAPLTIFIFGRTVGWLAHALEQQARGGLIRPRARYVGPL